MVLDQTPEVLWVPVDVFIISRKHTSPYYVLVFPDNPQVNPLFRFCYFEVLTYNQCIRKRLAMPK